jgi:hypothetical protein
VSGPTDKAAKRKTPWDVSPRALLVVYAVLIALVTTIGLIVGADQGRISNPGPQSSTPAATSPAATHGS